MNILIIEDEERVAKRLQRLVKEIYGKESSIINIENELESALDYLANNSTDLILLDLELGGDSGFDILKRFVAGSFHTIIVSAHKEFALQAFEYGVLDFVPKPFSQQRLEKAFQQMERHTAIRQASTKYLSVRKSGKIELVSVEEILYIKGCGAYSELYLKNGKTALHDKNLNKLHALLPTNFERIHKSYIAPINEVQAFLSHPGSKYELTLRQGSTLPVGRTHYKELKKRFSEE